MHFLGIINSILKTRSTPIAIERYENFKSGVARIAASCSDGSIRLLSPITGNTILTLFPADKDMYLKQFSYNMDWYRLFYLCTNGDIIIYDTSTSPGRIIEILESSQLFRINSLFSFSHNLDSSDGCFRPRQNILRLIVGTVDGQIVVLNNGKPEKFVQVMIRFFII